VLARTTLAARAFRVVRAHLHVQERPVVADVFSLANGRVPLHENASDVRVDALAVGGDHVVDSHAVKLGLGVAE
jgi:hypothetical protein